MVLVAFSLSLVRNLNNSNPQNHLKMADCYMYTYFNSKRLCVSPENVFMFNKTVTKAWV
jgi:hypothetical protein